MKKRRTSLEGTRKLNGATMLLMLLVIVAAAVLHFFPQYIGSNDDTTIPSRTAPLPQLELPATRPADRVVAHRAFTLLYNDTYEQAAWVAYVLTPLSTAAGTERSNNFVPDKAVPSGSANDADYEGSGYDRGHLAPAEDLSWSQEVMNETFYYSNVSPQESGFNRGVWKRLEELVRYWSSLYDTVYVVTGPVLKRGLRTVGPGRVAVPRHFYKAVLRYGSKGVEGIAFVLPHQASSDPLSSFAVTIDSLEHLTALDLYPRLPDSTENAVEGRLRTGNWQWRREQ